MESEPTSGGRVILRFILLFAGLLFVILLLLPSTGGHPAWISARTQSKHNLKTVGLALHSYHDVNRTFPPSAIVQLIEQPTNGHVEQHSWMTMLLPYIDDGYREIYDQIDFHKPWNVETNRHAFKKQIPEYQHPQYLRDDKEAGLVAEFAAAHYAGNSQLLQPNRLLRIRDIADGASFTLMAGEVNTGFLPWGSPGNVRDPANGIGRSAIQFQGDPNAGNSAQFLMADGSVRNLNSDIDSGVLANLANPSDGCPTNDEMF